MEAVDVVEEVGMQGLESREGWTWTAIQEEE